MNFNSLYPKNYVQRDLEPQILQFIEDREIIVIRGPRQSGKTTLLAKLGKLLQEKYSTNQVFFLNLEDELEKEKLARNPRGYLEFYLRDQKKVFFLIDEIQYLKNGGKILKLLFDSYPRAKFIVSGSSTLDIAQLGRYLVGRALFFELYPFSFAEFLKVKDQRAFREYQINQFSWQSPVLVKSAHQEKLNQYLLEYLTFGGYPKIVLEKNREKKIILLKNLFTTYLEKDLVQLYGLKYKEKAVKVLQYLASTLGSLINFNDLSQMASLYFQEVKEILNIFEETYVLKQIRPFHRNLVTELKKNPKYYFLDLGLRNTLVEKFEFDDQELGVLLENYAFLILKEKKPHFWRTTAKAEVDFIIQNPIMPLEVKKTAKISRSLTSFINSYQPETAIMANWQESRQVKKNKTTIFFIPLSLL